MSAKSKAQYKFMKAVEGGYIHPKGLSTQEAKEYTKSNVGNKRFSKLKERLKKKD